MAEIVIDGNRCKGCELCVSVCPQQVLAMSQDTNIRGQIVACVAEPARCIGCRLCCLTCPDVAIEMRVEGTYYRYFLG